MPKLILFGICEKSLLDPVENRVSMIGLTNSLAIQIPNDVDVTPNTVAPIAWVAVTTWFLEPEDQKKTFLQKIQVISPSNELALPEAEGRPFQMGDYTVNNTQLFTGFPIGEEGTYNIRVSLRELDTEGTPLGEWQERGSVPFALVYAPT